MRRLVSFLMCGALLTGCATSKPDHQADKTSKEHPQPIVTRASVLTGKVVSVKSDLGIAVLVFPVGILPGMDQHLNVYRQGVKIGEVKVTGPQQNNHTVVDVVNGTIQPGDEVRAD